MLITIFYITEDNNTRVLFERVLSSGGLTPQLSVEVWNRFLEFESNIGDLSSIVKVERRRCAIMAQLKEFEGKETAQLVDRYKFLDLYPCSSAELKSIGYAEQYAVKGGVQTVQPITDDNTPVLIRPDFSQMIPYKPKANAYPGEHPLPGGSFPQPPALAHLCSRLPPPQCFHGPFVIIDKLIDIFNRMQLPDGKINRRFMLLGFRLKVFSFLAPVTATETGLDVKLFDLAKSVHWIIDENQSTHDGLKRRRIVPGGDDSDDEEKGPAPPPNDIYRLRQQKRMK